MKLMTSSNPRLTMRSASSMTTYVHWARTSTLRSRQSLRRPGVAMTISAPSRMLNCCSSMALPPTIDTQRYPSRRQNLFVSASICCASSRVGARTRAYGPRERVSSVRGGRRAMYDSIGIVNAAVLPEPASVRPCVSSRIEGRVHERETKRRRRRRRTRLGDADQVAVLQADGDGLALNRARLLVPDRVDGAEDLLRDAALLPRAQRERDVAACARERERV